MLLVHIPTLQYGKWLQKMVNIRNHLYILGEGRGSVCFGILRNGIQKLYWDIIFSYSSYKKHRFYFFSTYMKYSYFFLSTYSYITPKVLLTLFKPSFKKKINVCKTISLCQILFYHQNTFFVVQFNKFSYKHIYS